MDWAYRFGEYVGSVADKPFRYGSHDCLTFTNGAVRVLRGSGYADDIVGYGALMRNETDLIKRYRFASLPDFIDSRLIRREGWPARGSLVAFELPECPYFGLGIAWGDVAITVGEVGIEWTPMAAVAMAWEVECV